MNNILHCEKVEKTFIDGKIKQTVLQNVNLSIHEGETLAIMGASGSGKSTLLHLLGGLDKPTSGKIAVRGKIIHDLSETERCKLRNHTLGFIYQFHHLLPEFSLLENVCIPLLLQNAELGFAREKAQQLLDRVGLQNKHHRRISEISGGERQRVAIARALVTSPKCVLADEPTGNLDQDNAKRILDILLSLNEALGTSLVIVTHDPRIADKMQHRSHLINGALQIIS